MENINQTLQTLEAHTRKIAAARAEINQVILGQATVIDHCLTSLLAGGHILLIGLPGLGKTRLVETLGHVLGLQEKRVQFTPDLMPSDIIGSEILDEDSAGQKHFRYIKGPLFCQLFMADEINRASPRTQSALLQAMQEKRLSVAGHAHDLPSPFHVLATQNPLEQEGTYPLPEAQLDRFFMEINVDYPDRQAERAIILSTTGIDTPSAQQILTSDELLNLQQVVRAMPVGESVLEAILDLVRNARPQSSPLKAIQHHVAWGPGPRASQALMNGVKARSLLDGRPSPSLEDVRVIAAPILRHRMALNFAARAEGVGLHDIIQTLIDESL